jgi:uncharacterized protein YbcI
MAQIEQPRSDMLAVSTALVTLHKEQYGRGPTKARSHFAGPDTLVCTLEDVMLPAERKMVEIGHAERVRDTRVSFQVATEGLFVAAVEQIIHRQVRSFASAIDVKTNTAFEVFVFERSAGDHGSGSKSP